MGQCAVTALIVQDYLGGEILRGTVGEESHYWNRLPTGEELDLTASQFPMGSGRSRGGVESRDYILSFPETERRYRQLLENIEEVVATSVPKVPVG